MQQDLGCKKYNLINNITVLVILWCSTNVPKVYVEENNFIFFTYLKDNYTIIGIDLWYQSYHILTLNGGAKRTIWPQ